MSKAVWRRAGQADLADLAAFLVLREERCAGFTGRLVRKGELRLPSGFRGGVWISGTAETDITAAILCHPSRLAFPLLAQGNEGGRATEEGMAELATALSARSWAAVSAIGPARDVLAFERGCAYLPRVEVRYELMAYAPRPAAATIPPALSIGRASIQHAGALYPLQEAYEREEVLTPIHRFDAASCRVALERSIEEQLILYATEGGRFVGKAGTNARGFAVDQIGGVYVVPDRRGRGLGRALMESLLVLIGAEGRRAVLFVKPENLAAIGLYRALGFRSIDEFRADYYEA